MSDITDHCYEMIAVDGFFDETTGETDNVTDERKEVMVHTTTVTVADT